MLVDRGADVNAVDVTNGQTALMFAAARKAAPARHGAAGARAPNPHVTTKVVQLERVRVDANGDPLSEERGRASRSRRRRPTRDAQGRVFGATVDGRHDRAALRRARGPHRTRCARWSRAAPNVNLVSAGEKTSPIVEAIINGHLDIATLPARPAAPTRRWPTSTASTPLCATVDMRWRHNTWYPQPTIDEEKTSYLALHDGACSTRAPT